MSAQFIPTGAAHLSTNECQELDDWSAAVGFETDYRQMSPGGFEAWFDMCLTRELRIVDQYCNRETSVSGVPPKGYLALILPRNEGPRGIFQGKELGQNEVAFMRPGIEGSYKTPADLRMLTILVPESRLRPAIESMADASLESVLPETRLVSLPGPIVQRMQSLADKVLASSMDDPSHIDPGRWLSEIDDHFLTAFTSGLTLRKNTQAHLPTRDTRARRVRAARDYIHSHLDEPIGLDALARVTGTSPRSLSYAFREIFDLTPLQYIKNCRLHAARRQLMKANAAESTVAEIAVSKGFNHLSYFSRDYHALFGEYPSETLRG